MVTNSSCSTRYNRRSETQNVLEHIHGGAVGSLFGAWDFVAKFASKDLIEKFVLEYKKGKFIEKLYGNFTSAYYKSDQAMNQSIAAKYAGHLSRRKFIFFAKSRSPPLILIPNNGVKRTLIMVERLLNYLKGHCLITLSRNLSAL